MLSQVCLTRIEAENVHTKLVYLEKLEIFTDSLLSLVETYKVNTDLLENKISTLNQFTEVLQNHNEIQDLETQFVIEERDKLAKQLAVSKQRNNKARKRRWYYAGGGFLVGVVGTILVTK